MVARAVTRVWQASLQAPQPAEVSSRAGVREEASFEERAWSADDPWPERGGWQRRSAAPVLAPAAEDDAGQPPFIDGEEDPEIRVAKRHDIVPRRPGVVSDAPPSESLWSSHLFWKGVVIGAAVVLLVKTALAVQAPYGIDWYG